MLLVGSLFGSQLMWAQHHNHQMTDAHIAGHVLDAHTGEHLSFVNVQVEGTALGCLPMNRDTFT